MWKPEALMPRDIPVGNSHFLVTFDQHYQMRDLYFPHVGQENHAGGAPSLFGVWAKLPPRAGRPDRRQKRCYWTNKDWRIELGYQDNALATDVRLTHDHLHVKLNCCDVVDFHRPLWVRRIEVVNQANRPREIRLFHNHQLNLMGTKVGETAYFDPRLRCLIHYRGQRYLTAFWYRDGEPVIDEFATGVCGFNGAEGTWRDAEDGMLGGNTIAQGSVDSTMMLRLSLEAGQSQTVYMMLGAGKSYEEIRQLHHFVHREGPAHVVERTCSYWRYWLSASDASGPTGPPVHVAHAHAHDPGHPIAALPESVQGLYRRSLLLVRSQIDHDGAIIAANDSDVMQYSRDTYSYLWPRDGALVAAALDDAGVPDVSRRFFQFCADILSDHGCLLHKYNPDGSPASSWHPWISLGQPQIPIQEDETALVLWALWKHFHKYRDIEFVSPLWRRLIRPAGDFMIRFRDPQTHLPLPSYDLWEERWGVHAFTVAAVFAGLMAASRFARCFGHPARAAQFESAAEDMRQAFMTQFWSESRKRYLRRIVPLDHSRTARLMGAVLAGRQPTLDDANDAGALGHNDSGSSVQSERGVGKSTSRNASRQRRGRDSDGSLDFEREDTLDSSAWGLFAFGMLSTDDERLIRTMQQVEQSLWVNSPVGGMARYENDGYYQMLEPSKQVQGNPWFLCTLWLADWRIARAETTEDLQEALPILVWAVDHALPSGVMAEQVHPVTGEPLSVSPLTWSHATFVATVARYQNKLATMSRCLECGQPTGVLPTVDRPARP